MNTFSDLKENKMRNQKMIIKIIKLGIKILVLINPNVN